MLDFITRKYLEWKFGLPDEETKRRVETAATQSTVWAQPVRAEAQYLIDDYHCGLPTIAVDIFKKDHPETPSEYHATDVHVCQFAPCSAVKFRNPY
jgi:hypothetical protein